MGEDIGLAVGLIFARAIQVRSDAQLVEQALVVELRAAIALQQHRAHRIEPDLARMRGDQIIAVDIAGGIGQHGLVGAADGIDRLGHRRRRGGRAAAVAIEIEHHALHRRIRRGDMQRPDHVAQPQFLGGGRAARKERQRIGVGGLFDKRAVELDHQRAAARHHRIGARAQRGEQQPEEAQQEEQGEHILDAHQQLPEPAYDAHPALSRRTRGLTRRGLAGKQMPTLGFGDPHPHCPGMPAGRVHRFATAQMWSG